MTVTPEAVATPSAPALRLRTSFSWALVGNLGYAASQWLCVVILAKLMNPVIVGQYALAFAVTAPVIVFTNLRLRNVIATDTSGEYTFRDYMWLRAIMTLIAFVIILGIAFWSGHGSATIGAILVIGAAKSIDSICDIYYGLLQQQERMDVISKSQLINGVVTLGTLAVMIVLTRNLVWAATGSLVGSLMALVYVIVLIVRTQQNRESSNSKTRWRLRPSGAPVNWAILWKLTWLTLPLGIATTLGSLRTNVPQYAIEHMLGSYQLGVFAALSYFMVLGSLVLNALGQAVMPRLARYYSAGDISNFNRLMRQLFFICFALGVLGVVVALIAGKELLDLLYGSTYAQAHVLLVWLMIATAVSYAYVFLGAGVSAMRNFKIQAPIGVIALAVLVCTIVPLVKAYGMVGAAYALILTAVVEGAGYLWSMRSLYFRQSMRTPS